MAYEDALSVEAVATHSAQANMSARYSHPHVSVRSNYLFVSLSPHTPSLLWREEALVLSKLHPSTAGPDSAYAQYQYKSSSHTQK